MSTLFRILWPYAKRLNPIPDLKKQFEEEYGEGSVVDGIVATPTQEEVKMVSEMMLRELDHEESL